MVYQTQRRKWAKELARMEELEAFYAQSPSGNHPVPGITPQAPSQILPEGRTPSMEVLLPQEIPGTGELEHVPSGATGRGGRIIDFPVPEKLTDGMFVEILWVPPSELAKDFRDILIFPEVGKKDFGEYLIYSKGDGEGTNVRNEITTLLDNMPELTGSTRDKLLSAIQNNDLAQIVNQLYRPNATVGDGGTASILAQEFLKGVSTHLIKAQERLKQLNDIAKSGILGINDLNIIDALRNDLENAINLFK